MPDNNSPVADDRRVFINCPFAAAHRAIFDAVVFTLIWHGFKPVLAQHRKSGGRLDYIRRQAKECALSVHDVTPLTGGEGGARQNTAFELGLWLGMGRDDDTLILVADQSALARTFSDLNGHDCLEHGDDGGAVVRKLAQELPPRAAETAAIPKPRAVANHYRKFHPAIDSYCREWGWEQKDNLAKRVWLIWNWIEQHLP